LVYFTLVSKETKRENFGVLGSLGRQSHARFEALFVPLAQEFGGVFKDIGWNTQIIHAA